eukprot:GCRY01006292.1.p1 GENE.GCRY01006292.1~~GCRY01006292.1.p1  ORF type:complete len:1235 (-),score=75.14 GCRY01006292.1:103-3807(-)
MSRLSRVDSICVPFLDKLIWELKLGRLSFRFFNKFLWKYFRELVQIQNEDSFFWLLQSQFKHFWKNFEVVFSIPFVDCYQHLWPLASYLFLSSFDLVSSAKKCPQSTYFSHFFQSPSSFFSLVSDDFWSLLQSKHQITVENFLNYLLALSDTWAQDILNYYLDGSSLKRYCPSPHLLRKMIVKTRNYFSGFLLMETQLSRTSCLSTEDFFALFQLYSSLSLFDSMGGLLNLFFEKKSFSISLSLSVGLWEAAANSILDVIKSEDFQNKLELHLWEQQFMWCLENLMFYDIFGHYSAENCELEGLKTSFWNLFRWSFESLHTADHESEQILTVEQLLFTKDFHQLKTSLSKAIDETLKIWHLPLSASILTLPHLSLLPRFQLLVEIEESSALLHHIISNTYHRSQVTHDLRALFSTWRERLPNIWESSFCWTLILALRFRVFQLINYICRSVFDASDPNSFVGFHEMAWTINQLATSVRQNGFPGVALNILNNIHDLPNIEVQDAFVKLKEQAMCYGDIQGAELFGLDIINKTNLDYYPVYQKAEFFAIKGWFLSKAGYLQEANEVFLSGIKLSDSCVLCWKLWGDFCFGQRETSNIAVLYNAFNCYLHAVKNPSQRLLLVQVLNILSSFEDIEFTKLLEYHYESIPYWIWLFWLNDLLFLMTFESYKTVIGMIFHRISSFLPQTTFIALRAFLHQEKHVGKSLKSHDYHFIIEFLLARLRQNHSATISSLEKLLHELSGQNFIVEPERFLLSYIQVILTRCHSHNHPEEYTTVLQSMLSAIRKELFSEKFMIYPKFSQKRKVFQEKFHHKFLDNFFSSQNSIKPVVEIVYKLLWWKSFLKKDVETFSSKWSLKDTCVGLLELNSSRIGVPGQLFGDSEPILEHYPKIHFFDNEIDVLSFNSGTTSDPCLTVFTNVGKKTQFLIRHHRGGQYGNSNDIRMMHFGRFVNKLFSNFNETRRRGIEMPVYSLVPINSEVSLQAYYSSVSLEDVLSAGLHSFERSVDSVILQFKNAINRVISFLDIVGSLETADYLQKYLLSTCSFSPLGFFGFRQFFTQSVAVMSVITLIFSIHDRTPKNMQLCFKTGFLLHTGLRIGYDRCGSISSNEPPVPFRLTPSLIKFISPIGLEGSFLCSFYSSLIAFANQQDLLLDYLTIFMREDLSSSLDPHSSARFLPDIQHLGTTVDANKHCIKQCIEHYVDSQNDRTPHSLRIHDLLNQASNPIFLSLMNPSWHSWF